MIILSAGGCSRLTERKCWPQGCIQNPSSLGLSPQVSAVQCMDALLTFIQRAEQGPCLSIARLLPSCQGFGTVTKEMEDLCPRYAIPLHTLIILSSNYNVSSETTQGAGTRLSFPLSTLPVSKWRTVTIPALLLSSQLQASCPWVQKMWVPSQIQLAKDIGINRIHFPKRINSIQLYIRPAKVSRLKNIW